MHFRRPNPGPGLGLGRVTTHERLSPVWVPLPGQYRAGLATAGRRAGSGIGPVLVPGSAAGTDWGLGWGQVQGRARGLGVYSVCYNTL